MVRSLTTTIVKPQIRLAREKEEEISKYKERSSLLFRMKAEEISKTNKHKLSHHYYISSKATDTIG